MCVAANDAMLDSMQRMMNDLPVPVNDVSRPRDRHAKPKSAMQSLLLAPLRIGPQELLISGSPVMTPGSGTPALPGFMSSPQAAAHETQAQITKKAQSGLKLILGSERVHPAATPEQPLLGPMQVQVEPSASTPTR